MPQNNIRRLRWLWPDHHHSYAKSIILVTLASNLHKMANNALAIATPHGFAKGHPPVLCSGPLPFTLFGESRQHGTPFMRTSCLTQVHTHASYSYCDEMDTFKTASYLADMKQPGMLPLRLFSNPRLFQSLRNRQLPRHCVSSRHC